MTEAQLNTQSGNSTETLVLTLKEEYKSWAKDYAPLINPPTAEQPPKLDPEIINDLDNKLPQEEIGRVVSFAAKLTSMMPESFDAEHTPTSAVQLRAMIAAAYLKDVPDENDREMYTRAMLGLADGTVSFSNTFGSTEDALNELVEKGYDKKNFNTFAVKLVGSTLPVVGWSDSKEEDFGLYKRFKTDLAVELDKVRPLIKQKVEKHLPNYDSKKIDQMGMPVYVDQLNRGMPFTNDFQTNEERQYNSAVSAAAVTFDPDPVTGLGMVASKLPYDYNFTEEQFIEKGETRVADKPPYKEAHTFVHEAVHDVAERNFVGDWKTAINEMLTDSASSIIQIETHGAHFGDPNSKEYKPFTGYQPLVNFAEDLVSGNVVTAEENVEYGLRQDPDGFMRLLSERVAASDDAARIAAESLARWRLVPMLKQSEIPEIAEKLKHDASGYLETEMMKMWRLVGSGYLATPMYLLLIRDLLEEDAIYVDKIKKEFAEKNQGEKFRSTDLLYVPGSNKVFTDEAVDLFRKYCVAETKGPYAGYAKSENLSSYLIDNIDSVRFGDGLPENLRINGIDDTSRVAEVVRVTNESLGSFFYESREDSQKPEFVVNTASALYDTIGGVFEKNWKANGIDYDYRDIVRVIRDLMPAWYSRFDSRPQTVEELIEGTKIRIDALTTEIEPVDGYKYVPTQQQVFHYGGALNLDKTPSLVGV